MKVNIDITAFEQKIYEAYDFYKRSNDPYYSGKSDAYLDVLCQYLGKTEKQKIEYVEKIIKKYQEKTNV